MDVSPKGGNEVAWDLGRHNARKLYHQDEIRRKAFRKAENGEEYPHVFFFSFGGGQLELAEESYVRRISPWLHGLSVGSGALEL